MISKRQSNYHNKNKKISLIKDNWYNLSDINIWISRYQNKTIKRYIDLHG
jgi:lambda repressor-like predicted transcriptional regulator